MRPVLPIIIAALVRFVPCMQQRLWATPPQPIVVTAITVEQAYNVRCATISPVMLLALSILAPRGVLPTIE